MSLAHALTEIKYARLDRKHVFGGSSYHKVALRAYNRALRAHNRAECRNALEAIEQDIAADMTEARRAREVQDEQDYWDRIEAENEDYDLLLLMESYWGDPFQ